MKISKNKRAVILAITAALILAILFLPIFPRLYLGDRIKGTVTLKIDGQTADMSECEFDLKHGGE